MKPSDRRLKVYITLCVTAYILGLLTWEYYHGGIESHHLLHRSDLPAISNGWGAIFLPILTWLILSIIHRYETSRYSITVIAGFMGALLYGVVFSIAFVSGMTELTSVLLPMLMVTGLFLPLYRAEYLLGLVLAMSSTFGVLLSLGFGLFVMLISFVLYRYVRPVPYYLIGLIKK
ncbi:hypothetical protein [Shewanella surugensis]|uniref:Tripartite tricarboxylate transporter TctB family protein n=1 Tax=Shewanella surugensis TaxID=212020 RepID=A0ABT0LE55_9GAMM|nr:hypothetical protein [Shewanella surugensis]MCL1125968.1 hypothetical protein [Shewanella surugensis]